MEAEKKRKRPEKEKEKEKEKPEEIGRERCGKEAEQVEAPSEEEVEEFFEILRRMQVAVKYFGKSASNIEDAIIGDTNRKVTALETEVDAVNINEDKGGGLELDLNAVPDAEESV